MTRQARASDDDARPTGTAPSTTATTAATRREPSTPRRRPPSAGPRAGSGTRPSPPGPTSAPRSPAPHRAVAPSDVGAVIQQRARAELHPFALAVVVMDAPHHPSQQPVRHPWLRVLRCRVRHPRGELRERLSDQPRLTVAAGDQQRQQRRGDHQARLRLAVPGQTGKRPQRLVGTGIQASQPAHELTERSDVAQRRLLTPRRRERVTSNPLRPPQQLSSNVHARRSSRTQGPRPVPRDTHNLSHNVPSRKTSGVHPPDGGGPVAATDVGATADRHHFTVGGQLPARPGGASHLDHRRHRHVRNGAHVRPRPERRSAPLVVLGRSQRRERGRTAPRRECAARSADGGRRRRYRSRP